MEILPVSRPLEASVARCDRRRHEQTKRGRQRQFAMLPGAEFIERKPLMIHTCACALRSVPVILSRYEFDFDLAPERSRGAV
jgi:hypothetical protein